MLQAEVIDLIKTLKQSQVLVVEAEAGCGKTWAVMAAIAELPANARVAIAAPTHVAVEELQSKLHPTTKCEVEFKTTASLTGRILSMNKAAKQLQVSRRNRSISYDLVVIDELSACPKGDLHKVLTTNCPLVLLGDQSQLDAVMSGKPAVWSHEWDEYSNRSFTYATMDVQYRQDGSIYQAAQNVRYYNKGALYNNERVRIQYSKLDFRGDFLEVLKLAYAAGKDLSQYCMMCYTNKQVAEYRDLIRSEVFCSDGFVVGEAVRVKSSANFANGKVLKVEAVEDSITQIKTHTVITQTITAGGITFKAVHPKHLAAYNSLLEWLKEEDEWDAYFLAVETVAVVANANAMTVHKAQGRSIECVWVDQADIGRRQKLRYVAYGRASQWLTVYVEYNDCVALFPGETYDSLQSTTPKSLALVA